MTALEATALAQARQAVNEMTPERLADWMADIFTLIRAKAATGKFALNLGDFLASRNGNEHASIVVEELTRVGFLVTCGVGISCPLSGLLVSWYPKDEH